MNKSFKTWLVLICSVQLVRGDCDATDELHRCFQGVQNVFLKPNFIFPTSQDEIDQSCSETFPKMWSEFVSCVTNFTETCFRGPEKAQIHQAVGKSINSIHKLCTNKDMQADYHNVSTCLRNKISENNSQCGIPYQKFVQDANQGYEHLCCSYDEFKTCLLDESIPCCDGPECQELKFSSELAKSWLEQAFGFMFKHCQDLSFCQPSTTATTTSTFTTKTTPLLPQRTTQSYAYYPVSQDEEEVNDDSDDIIIAENLETSTLPKNTIVTTEPSTTQAEPEDVYFEQSATQPSLSTRQGASRPTFRAPQEPRSLDERLNLLSDVTPVPRSASSSSGPSSKSTLVAFWARSLLPPLLLLFWERRA